VERITDDDNDLYVEDFPEEEVKFLRKFLDMFQFLEDPQYVYDHELIKSEAQVN
jgi:hypothetical protein